MESSVIESKNAAKITPSASTVSGSNQLFIAENLELDLPEDTFRMSLDNFSVIGENVTIAERESSVDTIILGTPLTDAPLETPEKQMPKSPPTSLKLTPDNKINETTKTPTLLKLSLTKKHENDMFIKPSPVAEVMSPARMLQYEICPSTPYTPTMKRAAIDFDFFIRNKFDKYFEEKADEEEKPESIVTEKEDTETEGHMYVEIPVIVDPRTVRHEIGDVR